MINRLNQTLTLQDGRSLGYAEYGDPDGKPVFYFHGHPSSRLDWPLFDPNEAAYQLGAHLIAPDRPGHGLSDYQRGRSMLDWPADVIELANALQIDRFAVLGVSGGGPYAAACAFKTAHRLTKTAIVCGMGPAEAPGATDGISWIYAGKAAIARNVMLKMMAIGLQRDPDKFQRRFLSQASATLPAPDVELLENSEFANSFLKLTFGEALRPGITGASHDAKVYSQPWGFHLEDITCEVCLWHGELDRQVLPSVGHYVADAIPNCHAIFARDEGHLSLPRNCVRDILSVLVSG